MPIVESEAEFSRLSSLLETILGPQLRDELLVEYLAKEVFLFSDDRIFKMIERRHVSRDEWKGGEDRIDKSSTLFGVPHAVAGEPSRSRLVPMTKFWPATPDIWTEEYAFFYDARGIYPPGKLVSRNVKLPLEDGPFLIHSHEIAGEEHGTIVRVYMKETRYQEPMCSRRIELSRHICRMPISPFARYDFVFLPRYRGVQKMLGGCGEPEDLKDILRRKFPEVYHNFPEVECVDLEGRILSRKWRLRMETGDLLGSSPSFHEIYTEDGERIASHADMGSIVKMPESHKKICHYDQKEPF